MFHTHGGLGCTTCFGDDGGFCDGTLKLGFGGELLTSGEAGLAGYAFTTWLRLLYDAVKYIDRLMTVEVKHIYGDEKKEHIRNVDIRIE